MTKNVILKYFDLNERALKGETDYEMQSDQNIISADGGVHEDTINYHSETRRQTAKNKFSTIKQITMYVGIFFGVLCSNVLLSYEKGEILDFSNIISVSNIIISFIIAFVILPVVYQKLRLKQNTPFLIQFALFF